MQVLVDPQFLTDPTSLGFAGDMSILGVDVDELVNSGNYYDIVQLQDRTISTSRGTSRKIS